MVEGLRWERDREKIVGVEGVVSACEKEVWLLWLADDGVGLAAVLVRIVETRVCVQRTQMKSNVWFEGSHITDLEMCEATKLQDCRVQTMPSDQQPLLREHQQATLAIPGSRLQQKSTCTSSITSIKSRSLFHSGIGHSGCVLHLRRYTALILCIEHLNRILNLSRLRNTPSILRDTLPFQRCRCSPGSVEHCRPCVLKLVSG